ncbi:MAG: glucose-1-phosphate thymidylyltransferase [Verrucomicrobiales bacterium]|nr:glucose-1-phosphate thymidylyltransferase [Verrucomicrobiales bacterium]
MKGIILAGGSGSRLYPLSQVASKQLQAVYDKPMVYYPIVTLMENGVREFCLISTPRDLPRFEALLGDGSQWGISIEYLSQPKPEGIAQAFIIAERFIDGGPVTLILGDNIFYGSEALAKAYENFNGGAIVFAYQVNNPERYGVVEFDVNGKAISLEEKPSIPKSSFVVPGLYLYDSEVVQRAKKLEPSARGELEITALNEGYLRNGALKVHRLGRGFAWLDSGTSQSLHEAAAFVQTIEKRQGIKIGCPEEAAWNRRYIDAIQFDRLLQNMPACEYKDYLNLVRGGNKYN